MRSKRGLALVAALTLLGYAGLHRRLRRYEIAESSMEPALRPGDYVVARRRRGSPERGAIVIFNHPEAHRYELTKRIVGLPGESILLSNGRVHVNDAVLAEPWADGPTRPDGEWKLGPDQVFVLGDNRAASAADGRTLGPLPVAAMGWRIIARYWPLHQAGRLTP